MFRIAVSMMYVALMAWFFVDYYLAVRAAPADTAIDPTLGIIYVLVPAALLIGVLIARWWVIPLPLVAFPIAAVMFVVGTFDDRYSDVASDRGGAIGFEWFDVAWVVCVPAVPAAAFGAGLRALGASGRGSGSPGARLNDRTGRIVGKVALWLLLLPVIAVVGGVLLVLAFGSLLGAALIIGGTMGLAIAMLPAIAERITAFLSTGSLRRRI